jgi:lipid A 3-O-deacylase
MLAMFRMSYFLSLFSLAVVCGSPLVWAQDSAGPQPEKTVQEQVPKEILNDENNSFVTLTIENDLFGGGKDGDYTSGVLLTYFDTAHSPQKLAHWLGDTIPGFNVNETTSVSYSIGQNLYTPDDITIRAPQPDKRPWAGFLYGTMGLSTLEDNHIDDLGVTLGIVGPWAQGRRTQEAIHDLIDTRDPSGWNNQLENEPGLIMSWRRRWPEAYYRELYDLSFSVTPNVGVNVGNIYTFAETGFTMRLTPRHSRWQDTPSMVQPSIPGSGFFKEQKQNIGWYLFGGAQSRAVARNIFLDGNTFTSSASVDKKPLVFDVNAGIALTFGNTRISYTAVYRTKEFDGQDDNALFGGISIGYKF